MALSDIQKEAIDYSITVASQAAEGMAWRTLGIISLAIVGAVASACAVQYCQGYYHKHKAEHLKLQNA